MSVLLEHRVGVLEKDLEALEVRVRTIEIAYAKVTAWAAGAAFAGGFAWSLIKEFFK